jgi:isocitrate dehydrogenase
MARADIDGTPEVRKFAETLEDVIIKTVESGKMTKDLSLLVGGDQGYQTTDEFMASLAENLKARLG